MSELNVLKDYILSEGLSKPFIDVYNHWINNFAKIDICSRELNFKEGKITFENLTINKPVYIYNNQVVPLTPKMSRDYKLTYSSDWFVDVVYRDKDLKEIQRRRACIGSIPVMVKSALCNLHNKTNDELYLLGEDPKDPGGYFIVGGVERTLLNQEHLAFNKILILNLDREFLSSPILRINVETTRGGYVTDLVLRSDVIYIEFYSGSRLISTNVLRFFRLYKNFTKDQIIELISSFIRKEFVTRCIYKLTKTLVDFLSTPNDIASILNKKETTEEDSVTLNKILYEDLFPHINTIPMLPNEEMEAYKERLLEYKVNLLAIVISRFLEYLAGFRPLDNRDSWSNRRVETAGILMSKLLRSTWREVIVSIQQQINNNKIYGFEDLVNKISNSTNVTNTFYKSFTTSEWGTSTFSQHNVSQPLLRNNLIATLSHINTVDVGISRSNRNVDLRNVQNDQWGYICPVYTPEGENSGLVKNLTITARVSLRHDDTVEIKGLKTSLINFLVRAVSIKQKHGYNIKLMINTKFLGFCNEETYRTLIEFRRSGRIPYDISLIKDDDWVYIDTSSSRLIRPLLVVTPEQELVIDKKKLHNQPIITLLENGALEYISPWEQEHIKIAPTKGDIIRRNERVKEVQLLEKSKPYTHCELDPMTILSISASLIPWINHNQAPRNTYQVSMSKQAVGIYHTNYYNRYDGKIKTLVFPTRPVVETILYNIIGLDERAIGENVTIAFMAFPFTEEDSFIVKKEFLENGGFRLMKYFTYQTVVRKNEEVTEEITVPTFDEKEPKDKYKYVYYNPRDPRNGLPMIGAPLRQGDCVIGKIQRSNSSSETNNASVTLRVGDSGVVDRVSVVEGSNEVSVTVKLRTMRVPQEGDKFAPRNAQKGTIGLVMSEADLPFTDEGITPDFIINTHCIPSRMTMEYPMELLASKYAAYKGIHINGSPFRPFEMNVYRNKLRELGKDEFGQEVMFSGTTGKKLDSLIFCGPVFFQALKHHVKDKIQARGIGHVKLMTRQPPKGRGNRGGLRFGEMERDAVISHGASAFLRERLMFASDAYEIVFCKNCGTFAVNDPNGTYHPCRICGSSTFGKCVIPYAYKLLIHMLSCFNINLRPEFSTLQEYLHDVLNPTQVELYNIEEIKKIRHLFSESDEILELQQKSFEEEEKLEYTEVLK